MREALTIYAQSLRNFRDQIEDIIGQLEAQVARLDIDDERRGIVQKILDASLDQAAEVDELIRRQDALDDAELEADMQAIGR